MVCEFPIILSEVTIYPGTWSLVSNRKERLVFWCAKYIFMYKNLVKSFSYITAAGFETEILRPPPAPPPHSAIPQRVLPPPPPRVPGGGHTLTLEWAGGGLFGRRARNSGKVR